MKVPWAKDFQRGAFKKAFYEHLYRKRRVRPMSEVDVAIRDKLRSLTMMRIMPDSTTYCRECGTLHAAVSHNLCEICFWDLWFVDMEKHLLDPRKSQVEVNQIAALIKEQRERILRQ